ncbi:HTTM domain-containing protein [Lacunimicrobium album]
MSRTTHQPASSLSQLEQFFFAKEAPYGMALMRISVSATMLWTHIVRFPYAREIYSTDGAIAQLSMTFGQGNYVPEFGGTAAVALYTILICACIGSIIGWQTRICLALSCLLYTYFSMLDALSTITKYSVIATHLLLLASLADSGAIWSVDAWLKGNPKRNPFPSQPSRITPTSYVWPARLTQLFIGIIYLGAACTKLHTPAFFNGDQLKYWMLTQMNHGHPLGDYLSMHPAMVVISCYIAVIWEIMFIFTVFTKGWRIPMLLIGAAFHIGTTLMLGLVTFPLVMISGYLAFLKTSDVQWMAQQYRYVKRRYFRNVSIALPQLGLSNWQPALAHYSLLLFSCVIVVATSAGVQAENWMDPYKKRGPNGPLQLQPMPMEKVAELFKQEEPLREIDRIFSFRLGTLEVSEIIIDPRTEFTQGDLLVAQVSLTPPHGDMFLECVLVDADGDLLHQEYYITPRDTNLVTFRLNMCETLLPGNYAMVLRANAKEVQRQPFTLKPGVCKVPQ